MSSTRVNLITQPVDKDNPYDVGGYVDYSYERIGSIVRYYVYAGFRPGNGHATETVTITAKINGTTKTGSVIVAGNYGQYYTGTLGPWDVEISSPTDTAISGCTVGPMTHLGSKTFAAVVPAGGDIPVYVRDGSAVKRCRKVYFRDGNTIKPCTVYLRVGSTIKKIG